MAFAATLLGASTLNADRVRSGAEGSSSFLASAVTLVPSAVLVLWPLERSGAWAPWSSVIVNKSKD